MFKKLVFSLVILLLNFVYFNFVNAQTAPQNLFSVDANTIALWRFNDLSGNTITDETGINNGTAIGTTIVDGKFGKARYFNGSTDYITVPHSSILINFSQITLEAWVYPSGFDLGCWANAEDIISKGVDSNYGYINGYNLRIARNQDGSCAGASSFNQVSFSGIWHEPNQWYYVVSTYDGVYSKIYVNGVLESTNYYPNLTFTDTHSLYINHHLFGGGYQSSQRMRGLIDEIRISKVARSAEEISYYYNLAMGQNIIPSLFDLGQYKSDSITSIAEGGTVTESSIILGATLNSSSTNQLQLQAELRKLSENFTNQPTATSTFVSSGTNVTIPINNLIDGQYHWQARVIDDKGNASDWQEFGTAGNVDFEVKLPLAIKAANLAKELINQPYLWGGKGWDYNQDLFVAVDAIRTGYHFYNSKNKSVDMGSGVDCSGLVMWSYNRSFDPLKSRFKNFVKAESADQQYRYNTASITESELQPGDVMFFDFTSADGPNHIDHVAMYVGESGGYDIVSAADRTQGIIPKLKDSLKNLSGFRGFKSVFSALPPAVLVTAHSPIDLVVTDPDGFTITATTTVSSDSEYLREIPGVLYYSEIENGTDGNPTDQVYSYILKTGDYRIKVLPASSSSPTSTYTLDFSAGNQSLILAENVLISQIPSEGYGVTTSATGSISSFIPVAIDIKPGSYLNSINLKSNGVIPVAILGFATFDVKQIDPTTIKLASAPVKLKNNGQPMASYEDANEDGLIDLVVQIPTKSLQLTKDDIKANLEGKLLDGTIIKGSDSIRIIP